MKFHLLNRCQLITAAAAVVVLYIIVANNSVMYVYYIKVIYCNKELQLSLRRRRWYIW